MSYKFTQNIDTLVPTCALIEDYQTLIRAKRDGDWSLVGCVAECISDAIDNCPAVCSAEVDTNTPTPTESMDAYERYQLEWMIAHGYSLRDLMKALTEHQRDLLSDEESTTVDKIFADWEHDIGFGSEVWACRPEWEDAETKEKAARSKYPGGLKFFPSANSLIAMDIDNGILCRPDGSDFKCAGGHGVSEVCIGDCETCPHGKSCDYENGQVLLENGYTYKMGGYAGESEKLLDSFE